MLGIQTTDRRMVGAYESTSLRRPPPQISSLFVYLFIFAIYPTYVSQSDPSLYAHLWSML